MVRITLDGNVVSRSKNLRGILDYARKHDVARFAALCGENAEGAAIIEFGNGAIASVSFESFTVMRNWLSSRHSWAQVITLDADGFFYGKRK